MRSWEHRTLKVTPGGRTGGKVATEALDAELNRLGQQGWEVTSTFKTSLGQGRTREVIIVLRREKSLCTLPVQTSRLRG